MARFQSWVPRLFVISLFFLIIHVLDDALNLGEPRDWGVSVPEFLLIVASLYLILPPFGALLARRGHPLGFLLVMAYGLQAFYGAGLNHLRHLQGEFGGVGLIGRLLTSFGIDCLAMQGKGFVTGVLAMLGCGVTTPHTHAWWSTAVAAIDTVLNIPLVLLCAAALVVWVRSRGSRAALAGAPASS
ncbi:MAG: hypothetical protein HZB53_14465 [Chloroflexi bacterium]|nr:hypothetical protein [Chloroflexota bacterium]